MCIATGHHVKLTSSRLCSVRNVICKQQLMKPRAETSSRDEHWATKVWAACVFLTQQLQVYFDPSDITWGQLIRLYTGPSEGTKGFVHLFFPYAVLPKPCKQTLMCKIFSPLNCVWRPSLHSVKRSSKQLLYEEIDCRWDQVIWGHYMFVSEMQIKSFSCRDQPSVCFAQHDTTGIALIHVITLLSIHLFHRLDACQRIRFFFKDKSTILFDGSVMWMGEGLFAVLLRVVEKICIALTSAAVNMELQPSTA